ncbi:MAG: hypothetical protein QI223_08525 [Candidatus Korarchaeota archaeon]|nr:hypothetical protein [Candidatus Korarchaeota archaeon]
MRFYSGRELSGAPVVDSEGLVYGRASGLEVSESGLLLRVTEVVRDPETGREMTHEKGLVPVEEISAIAEGPGGPIVLLSTPREASYRGVRVGEPAPADLERAVGRVAVTLDGRVLGTVSEIVVGPGIPGLRVRASAGEVAWLRFLRDLRSRRPGLAARLEARVDPYKNPRVPAERLDDLLRALREEGAGEEEVEALRGYVEEVESASVDVPWPRVERVGDVVLVEGGEWVGP